MSVCVYDNPKNLLREAWQDGKVVAHISAELMASKSFRDGLVLLDFRLNVGVNFIAGRIYGDWKAIKSTELDIKHDR